MCAGNVNKVTLNVKKQANHGQFIKTNFSLVEKFCIIQMAMFEFQSCIF